MENVQPTPQKKTKHCPYCDQEIAAAAKKCRYCGEWLVSEDKRPQQCNPAPQATTPTPTTADEDNTVTTEEVLELGRSCLPGIIIIVLLVIAAMTKPGQEKHEEVIREQVVDITHDAITDGADMLGEGLGTLASLFMKAAATDEQIARSFDQQNTIGVDKSWFWSTGIIYNSDHPDGVTASFGIFGFVIPLVAWDDFKILDD